MSCGIMGDNVVFWRNGQIVEATPIIEFFPERDLSKLFPTIGIDGAVVDILVPQYH